jgi:MoaA/NifB/PqqE/SkfB family radical SAM enzyme
MDAKATFQKEIRGRVYSYDSDRDIIYYEGAPESRLLLDRTQVAEYVDLCFEVTRRCSISCENCFADAGQDPGLPSLSWNYIFQKLRLVHPDIVRVVISGGEPLLHPEIGKILELPRMFSTIRFVLSTNGIGKWRTVQKIDRTWLVALSLHGGLESHNKYTHSDSHARVLQTLDYVADRAKVQLYCVLHRHIMRSDIDYLLQLGEHYNVSTVRFIRVRPCGRFEGTIAEGIENYILETRHPLAVIKIAKSKTILISADQRIGRTN